MRLVIDTSTFVSALLRPETAPRSVLRHCFSDEVCPLMGNALFSEYEAILGRETPFRSCALNEDERSTFMDDFMSVCEWVTVYYLWRPNLRDEADNHLIELAMAGGATHIITGNIRDFRDADLSFPHLQIVTANQFIASWSK